MLISDAVVQIYKQWITNNKYAPQNNKLCFTQKKLTMFFKTINDAQEKSKQYNKQCSIK